MGSDDRMVLAARADGPQRRARLAPPFFRSLP
jgi:hypothetical protein